MKRISLWIPAFILTFLACSNTQLKVSWKDPAYDVTALRKVLVMAVVPQSTSQRVMEDAFVNKLSKHGAQGIPSYKLSPAENKLDEESWKRLIAENGVDTVLVARLVDVKTVEREVPPTSTVVNPGYGAYGVNHPSSSGWYGYYQNSYQVVTTPGYTVKDTFAVTEAKLWEVQNAKLVWTGTTHTQIMPDQDTQGLLDQYAGVIVNAIYKK